MIVSALTTEELALIKRFNDATSSIGMDGTYSLSPSDRGVIETTELAKKFTLLRAIQKLNLKGQAAKEFAWGLHTTNIPLAESEVDATLKEIFNAS